MLPSVTAKKSLVCDQGTIVSFPSVALVSFLLCVYMRGKRKGGRGDEAGLAGWDREDGGEGRRGGAENLHTTSVHS
jgi:hypothetical protein